MAGQLFQKKDFTKLALGISYRGKKLVNFLDGNTFVCWNVHSKYDFAVAARAD